MRFLLDTHLLLWAVTSPARVSPAARGLIEDPANDLMFSAVAIWEIAIKRGLNKPNFDADARVVHRHLLDRGYEELPVTAQHGAGVQNLPPLHRDPFDRILLAQAISEGLILLTADRLVLQYGQPARAV
jgi:PIN domain nuclease of toxin-antitoxin system